MAHKALYRTWRSQLFADLVGQRHIIRTLQNSLKEGRLSHAYLFSGPRGTGKTSAAKILAKAVNCSQGIVTEPCNECEPCRKITDGTEIGVLEIDAASNRGIDEIRSLRDKMIFAYNEVRFKVYIIDEVHMLTTEAFNALLKTLEEPPPNVLFILATTEPHKLPATIVSRCQRFDFERISLDDQVKRMELICRQEGISIDEDAVQYIARLSEGGMRDALSLLDQMISYTGESITYADVLSLTGGIETDFFEKLAAAIRDGDAGQALQLIEQMMQKGKSAHRCIDNVLLYYRDILMIKMVPASVAITDRILDASRFAPIAESYSETKLFRIIEVLNQYQTEMKYSTQPQTLLEVAVLKLCTLDKDGASEGMSHASVIQAAAPAPEELSALKERIAQLERQLLKLMQSGVAAPATDKSNHNALPRNEATHIRPSHSSASTSAQRSPAVKLEPYLKSAQGELFRQARTQWSQILAAVKEGKIMVHAWLVNGEPVASHDDSILVAFKSPIHRETTEKQSNKQFIEQVLTLQLGQPVRLATVMMKEWKEAQSRHDVASPVEDLQLEQPSHEDQQQEWIEEAVKLFGEDLVIIKDS